MKGGEGQEGGQGRPMQPCRSCDLSAWEGGRGAEASFKGDALDEPGEHG